MKNLHSVIALNNDGSQAMSEYDFIESVIARFVSMIHADAPKEFSDTLGTKPMLCEWKKGDVGIKDRVNAIWAATLCAVIAQTAVPEDEESAMYIQKVINLWGPIFTKAYVEMGYNLDEECEPISVAMRALFGPSMKSSIKLSS